MNFGIPKKRQKKVKIDFGGENPTLVVMPDGGKGTSKRLLLNEALVETLGVTATDYLSFAFEEDDLGNLSAVLVCVTTHAEEINEGDKYRLYGNADYAGLYIRNSQLWQYLRGKSDQNGAALGPIHFNNMSSDTRIDIPYTYVEFNPLFIVEASGDGEDQEPDTDTVSSHSIDQTEWPV